MAIYDWDGTTNNEIGKIYDWDGTASHQLGKGYDWDGTTSHLIYSAEERLFPNGSNWEAIHVDSHWSITSATPTNITINSDWWNLNTYANVVTSNAIDLSNYNTLSATFKITGIRTSDAYNDWYVGINSSKVSSPAQKGSMRVRTNGTYTVTFDISNLNGNYYIYFGGQFNYSNATCTVESIMLT